jgi:hypothetical protein
MDPQIVDPAGETPPGAPGAWDATLTSKTTAPAAAPKTRFGMRVWLALGVFVVLGGLMMTSALPGFVVQGLPGSSSTFVYGGQGAACASITGSPQTVVKYTVKLGFPLVYNFDSTSSVEIDCSGTPQSANGSHSTGFIPLAIVIDLVVAALLGLVAFAVLGRRFKRA